MLSIVAAVLTLVPSLQPQAPEKPATPPAAERKLGRATGTARRDVVELVGGEQIQGTVLKELGNYIEVRLAAGTVVGFERSRVVRVIRGGAAAVEEATAALASRDEWFLLHDGEGISAGWMHALVQPRPDGTTQLTEEWYFSGPQRKGSTCITILEVMDAELRPRSCFYHERVVGRRNRLLSERLLSADVEGSKLVVTRRTLGGREKTEYPFTAGSRFPLGFREEIRQRPKVKLHSAVQNLFVPETGQFLTCKVSELRRRRVELRGRSIEVREIRTQTGRRDNNEWVDASGAVVRREVNGQALVAVPVSQGDAKRFAGVRRDTGRGTAIAPSADAGLAIWLPNPIWKIKANSIGSVTIEARLYDATALFMELDQIDSNMHLATAADTMLRWLRLSVSRKLAVARRDIVQVRGKAAVQLELKWGVGMRDGMKPRRGTCTVCRVDGRYVALFCSAPRDAFPQLRLDFDRVLASVQLSAAEIQPVLQGPLLRSSR